jgi:hypothetical protein
VLLAAVLLAAVLPARREAPIGTSELANLFAGCSSTTFSCDMRRLAVQIAETELNIK